MAGEFWQALGQNEQLRRQNQQINDFLDLTSKGIDPQTAILQIAQKGTQYSGGLGGILQKFSAFAGGVPDNFNSLAPMATKGIIQNAYGQTRQRSNKFETFTGEDGKTHKGVFDNEGNMIRDMGIAPATSSSKTGKSANEKLYERYSKELENNPIVEENPATKRQLWLQSQVDKYGAKINSELGGESYTNSPIDGDAPALARSFLNKEFGKLSQGTKRKWYDDTYAPEDTRAAIENATQSLMKEGDYSEKDARRVILETYQGMKKGDTGKFKVYPDGIGGDVEEVDNTETAASISDPNAVINSAYESGVINDEDLAVINDVLKQDPKKIGDVLGIIEQKTGGKGKPETTKQFSVESDINTVDSAPGYQPADIYGASDLIKSPSGEIIRKIGDGNKAGIRMPFDKDYYAYNETPEEFANYHDTYYRNYEKGKQDAMNGNSFDDNMASKGLMAQGYKGKAPTGDFDGYFDGYNDNGGNTPDGLLALPRMKMKEGTTRETELAYFSRAIRGRQYTPGISMPFDKPQKEFDPNSDPDYRPNETDEARRKRNVESTWEKELADLRAADKVRDEERKKKMMGGGGGSKKNTNNGGSGSGNSSVTGKSGGLSLGGKSMFAGKFSGIGSKSGK